MTMLAIVRNGRYEGLQVEVIHWTGYYIRVVLPGDTTDPDDIITTDLKPNKLLFTINDIEAIMKDDKSRDLNENYKPKIDYGQRLISNYFMRFAERPEQYEAPTLPS